MKRSSQKVISNQPCPCGKSNSYAVYEDGSGYCFYVGCNHYTPPKIKEIKVTVISKEGSYKALPNRGLKVEELKFFGITVFSKKGIITHHRYPYYNKKTDSIAAVKIRDCSAKEKRNKGVKGIRSFFWQGDNNNIGLFGQNLFNKGGKFLTITEGELDAVATFTLLGSKYPVVSLVNGAGGALRDAQEHYEYINSFDTIVLCLDADEQGNKASKQIAKLLPGKVKIMRMRHGKDACEYLGNGLLKEFTNEWWRSDLYTPDGIIMGAQIAELALQRPAKGTELVWPRVSRLTKGIRKHELWSFIAGTGSGKTTLLHEIAYHMMVENDKRCGLLLLEEPPSITAQKFYGKDVDKRLELDDFDIDRGDIIKTAPNKDKLEKNLVIFDHSGVSDFESIMEKINYFVNGLNCEYIFLDHITALAEGKESDVNNRCHYMFEEFNRLLMNKPLSMFIVSHTRKLSGKPAEEGGRVTLDDAYGSGAIKQRSNFVFALEGNQQAEDVDERNTRYLRCLKDRNTGMATGHVVPLRFISTTGRLIEFEEQF